jgi:hypothetical protein
MRSTLVFLLPTITIAAGVAAAWMHRERQQTLNKASSAECARLSAAATNRLDAKDSTTMTSSNGKGGYGLNVQITGKHGNAYLSWPHVLGGGGASQKQPNDGVGRGNLEPSLPAPGSGGTWMTWVTYEAPAGSVAREDRDHGEYRRGLPEAVDLDFGGWRSGGGASGRAQGTGWAGSEITRYGRTGRPRR